MSHKQVHPRSIYRTPPSFKEMAINFPKFRKFAVQELSGRMTIDFKNPAALQALTTTLLKKDFGLDVEIPVDRLVPTVPSRLNYVLWVEDLLLALGGGNDEVLGIDIGAGASCIYSLLAAKTKGWHMLATEVDADNYKCAVENVRRNNLEHLIQVKQVDKGVALKGALLEGQQYDFCMCNPPFFSSEEELDPEHKSRSPARPPPHGCFTGSPGDVVVSGGEVTFVGNIVKESKELGTTVRIYSSMLGHKSSLGPVKSLVRAAGATSIVDTAFCQGRTTRWYLAWTFMAGCDLQMACQQTTPSSKKKNKPPLRWVVPQPSNPAHYTLASVGSRIKEIMQQLQISVRGLRSNDKIQSFQVTAFEKTWSNQRKKRRAALHNTSPNEENPASVTATESGQQFSEHSDTTEMAKESTLGCLVRSENVSLSKDASVVTQEKETDLEVMTDEQCCSSKRKVEGQYLSLSKKLKTDVQDCLLRAGVVVMKDNDDIVLEMTFVEGTGGRESLHQIMQYFKNNYKS